MKKWDILNYRWFWTFVFSAGKQRGAKMGKMEKLSGTFDLSPHPPQLETFLHMGPGHGVTPLLIRWKKMDHNLHGDQRCWSTTPLSEGKLTDPCKQSRFGVVVGGIPGKKGKMDAWTNRMGGLEKERLITPSCPNHFCSGIYRLLLWQQTEETSAWTGNKSGTPVNQIKEHVENSLPAFNADNNEIQILMTAI